MCCFFLPYPSLPFPELALSSSPHVFLYGPVHTGPYGKTSGLPCLALNHVFFCLYNTAATAPSELKALIAWAAATSASAHALPCPALSLHRAHPSLAACQVITSLCSPWPQSTCVLCHWYVVLMEYEPEQGLVRLTLASDLNRDQKALVSSLATAASEQWQQELHPGWSMAAADSELLLNQILQELQVLVCAQTRLLAADHVNNMQLCPSHKL